ncbi:hypothetical protein [Brevibacillus dissolubilis]|uniref:hypothetical protein n=1 Tax=Brevibacillus dissolubilis TaxID=1844116 RepID=UPI00159BE76C|nr:hypothetical protein [Brevibacillus dissolubilis]
MQPYDMHDELIAEQHRRESKQQRQPYYGEEYDYLPVPVQYRRRRRRRGGGFFDSPEDLIGLLPFFYYGNRYPYYPPYYAPYPPYPYYPYPYPYYGYGHGYRPISGTPELDQGYDQD